MASQIVCEDTAAQPVVRARSPPSGSALVQTLVLLLGLRRGGAVTSIAAAGRLGLLWCRSVQLVCLVSSRV